MKPVCIECQFVDAMNPVGGLGGRAIEIKMSMTDDQVRAAILGLLSGMGPRYVLGWLKSECPSLFLEAP